MNETIVVGVDGSGQSRAALTWAAAEARARNARLHAVVAWNLFPGSQSMPSGSYPGTAWRHADQAEEARRDLRRTIETTLEDGELDNVVMSAILGEPAEVLLDTAEREKATMLVVGASTRSGWRRAVHGSVAERCTTRAKCPVMVVHPNAGNGGG